MSVSIKLNNSLRKVDSKAGCQLKTVTINLNKRSLLVCTHRQFDESCNLMLADCHTMATADATRIQLNSSDKVSRNAQNGSVFHEYPHSRPFIHDDYRRDVTKPIIAYPESNRHGMFHH